MSDSTRINSSIRSITTRELSTETSTQRASEQKSTPAGIASFKDSIDTKESSPLSASASKASSPMSPLLQGAKSEISNFLQGNIPSDPTADIFSTMMQYLKLTQKEAREDRTIQRNSRELSLNSAEARIKLDNEKIDSQMQEAKEKASHAMNGATTSLVTGIVSGSITMGSAISQLKQVSTSAKADLVKLGVSGPAVDLRHRELDAFLDSLPQQKRANKTDAETKRLENSAAKDEDYKKASPDHRDRIRDAILSFLQKMKEMDPKI